ncbi:MAG: hypothetical protein M0Z42_06700 [Actinomycetota bacterium]|nr:hypothetical protein [Actinomycetota bacterium]
MSLGIEDRDEFVYRQMVRRYLSLDVVEDLDDARWRGSGAPARLGI